MTHGTTHKQKTNLFTQTARAMPTQELSSLLLSKLKERQKNNPIPRASSAQERPPTHYETFPSHKRDDFLKSKVIKGEVVVSRPCTSEADMSGFRLEQKRLNPACPGHHQRIISSRPVFGTADRFPRPNEGNIYPGPKYNIPEMIENGLSTNAPAYFFNGTNVDRSAYMRTHLRDEVLVTLTNTSSSDCGPAGYKVLEAYNSKAFKFPEYSWSVSNDNRFPKPDEVTKNPGPQYFTALKPFPGVSLGPKPRKKKAAVEEDSGKKPARSSAATATNHMESDEKKQDEPPKQKKKLHDDVVADLRREAGMQQPSHWARRVHEKQFIGTEFHAVGTSSPGPIYSVPGIKYKQVPEASTIVKSEVWNPPA